MLSKSVMKDMFRWRLSTQKNVLRTYDTTENMIKILLYKHRLATFLNPTALEKQSHISLLWIMIKATKLELGLNNVKLLIKCLSSVLNDILSLILYFRV